LRPETWNSVAALRLKADPSAAERALAGALDELAAAAERSAEVDACICRRVIVAALRASEEQAERLVREGQADAVVRAALGLPMGYVDRLVAELLAEGISPWGLTIAQASWVLSRVRGTVESSIGAELGILRYRINDGGEAAD